MTEVTDEMVERAMAAWREQVDRSTRLMSDAMAYEAMRIVLTAAFQHFRSQGENA